MVATEKVGREQRHRLVAAPLADAEAWLASVGDAWDRRLARLAGGAAQGRRPGRR
jgi:hypothetical protein